MPGKPPCAHTTFSADVTVVRLEDIGKFMAECKVRCSDCGVRFRWAGLRAGMSYAEPMVSAIDGFELRAPIEPDAHLTSLMAGL